MSTAVCSRPSSSRSKSTSLGARRREPRPATAPRSRPAADSPTAGGPAARPGTAAAAAPARSSPSPRTPDRPRRLGDRRPHQRPLADPRLALDQHRTTAPGHPPRGPASNPSSPITANQPGSLARSGHPHPTVRLRPVPADCPRDVPARHPLVRLSQFAVDSGGELVVVVMRHLEPSRSGRTTGCAPRDELAHLTGRAAFLDPPDLDLRQAQPVADELLGQRARSTGRYDTHKSTAMCQVRARRACGRHPRTPAVAQGAPRAGRARYCTRCTNCPCCRAPGAHHSGGSCAPIVSWPPCVLRSVSPRPWRTFSE